MRKETHATSSGSSVTRNAWGDHDGHEVFLFRLQNPSGAYAEVTNYGATLVSLVVPDENDRLGNVILGFPSLRGYVNDDCYIGRTVGRFANRIGNARFMLEGVLYQLEKNDNGNNNHGGFNGFHSAVFDFHVQEQSVVFKIVSEDLHAGFPGKVSLSVTYSFTEENELLIEYRATTDKTTILNITNHAYFNLSARQNNIFDHVLKIASDKVLETTNAWIPTGRILAAGARSFTGNRLREKMSFRSESVTGLNHYYIFDAEVEKQVVAVLTDPSSGRRMEVFTTYPGLQLYTGDFLTSKFQNHHGHPYNPFDGVCLECQYFPDSPNHEHFPSTRLTPEEEYYEKIVFKFSVAH